MLRLLFAVVTTVILTLISIRKKFLIKVLLGNMLNRGIDLVVKRDFGASNRSEADIAKVVYITNGGSKFHQTGCRFLKGDIKAISLETAIEIYSPCGHCQPNS